MIRNILCLCVLLSSILVFSCLIGDYELSNVKNVNFSPSVVKRGDVITITYNLNGDGVPDMSWLNDMSVDSNGILKYIGNDRDLIDLNHFKDRDFNDIIDFGIIIIGSETTEDGRWKLAVRYENGEGIFPDKYISFKWGEIKCIVPNKAVSGPIKVNLGEWVYTHGFSEKDLIVVDESGNEIW